jgi:hypothetical protein
MPGFFALAAETPTLRAARRRTAPFPEAASSLRPSAGGADERGSASGACCRVVAWRGRLLTTVPGAATPGTRTFRTGLAPERSSPHAPSTDSTSGLDSGSDWLVGRRRRGVCCGLSTLAHPEHPCREEDDAGTPSRFVASSVARRRPLVRPCGFPRDRRQSASKSVSTTDVSQHEHPSKHHLRRLSAERRGKTRRRSPFQILLGAASPRSPKKTPDHLAVIRPPTAARLTARRRLRADRTATRRALAQGREERCCLVGRATAPSNRAL